MRSLLFTILLAAACASLVGTVVAAMLARPIPSTQRTLTGRGYHRNNALSDDGGTLAEVRSGDRTCLALVDLSANSPDIVLFDEPLHVWHLQFIGGRRVAALLCRTGEGGDEGDDLFVRIWDAADGRELRRFECGKKQIIYAQIWFNDEGDPLLLRSSALDELRRVRLLNLRTGECVVDLGSEEEAEGGVKLRGGRLVQLNHDASRTIRNAATGEVLGRTTPPAPADHLWTSSFEAAGELSLVSHAEDAVRLWNVRSARCAKLFRHTRKWKEAQPNSPPMDAGS